MARVLAKTGAVVIAHLSYVMCDLCYAAADYGDDGKEARVLAQRAGWDYRKWNKRVRDVCPACQGRRKAPAGTGEQP